MNCDKKHHPLLHKGFEELLESTSEKTKPKVVTETKQPNQTAEIGHHGSTKSTLYRILPVHLHNDRGQRFLVYALLDEGSSVTLIDEDLANDLNLEGPTEELCLKWTSNVTREEENSRRVKFEISGCHKDKRYEVNGVHTVKSLSLPSQTLSKSETDIFDGLPIATYKRITPKILIGLPHWNLALPIDFCEDIDSHLMAIKCRLGWTIAGSRNIRQPYNIQIHDCQRSEDVTEVLKQLKTFFSIEYFGVRSMKPVESDQNIRARTILETTITKVNNRYQVGLLWKDEATALPDSRPMALQRLRCFERKLAKDPNMYAIVRSQIADYLQKGYIEELSVEEAKRTSERTWYLPLFAVVNPNKPGKVRLVWDAAARVKDVSLNNHLISGPDLLSPLIDVLRRFRQYKTAVTADIKEMFHRVMVSEADRDSQRFLWRNSSDVEPTTYRMNVMTFGATCSPYSAQFVKNYNAAQFQENYPEAVNAIIKNHYVDDFADSFKSAEEAARITRRVTEIHSSGGFELRGFASNDPQIPLLLGETEVSELISLDSQEDSGTTKVLGLYWKTSDDTLNFHVNMDRLGRHLLDPDHIPTKREVLKTMMTIYDPLGLIAPLIVRIKLIMQEVWKTGIDWDETITTEQNKRWRHWLMDLQNLQVSIPRCYEYALSAMDDPTTELHIFVDASQDAFSAVAYFRTQTTGGEYKCSLVGAKSKVAPLKPLSIPRLELQAAVLGLRLAESIELGHTLKISKRTFWTDSMNVLGWINSEARNFKVFVALRIGEILELSEVKNGVTFPSISIYQTMPPTLKRTHSGDKGDGFWVSNFCYRIKILK